MSVFNLNEQNSNIDFKIVAGLERLSQVFRILLWESAKEFNLSPIQIQLLIFIYHHSREKTTISYLAQEFNLTKPTISDSIKVLENKNLILKTTDTSDTRSYTIQLTNEGIKIVTQTENYPASIVDLISQSKEEDKTIVWSLISDLIIKLNKIEVISVQRTCFNCKHFTLKNKSDYCNLLNQKLLPRDIRLDCSEFG
jgi:DNA-binding MarR family transcriptional regulator